MTEEIWKDIPGFEGRYQVSNLGKVKSLDRKTIKKDSHGGLCIQQSKGMPLKQFLNGGRKGTKYPFVVLTVSHSIQKSYNVHRLVALVFVDNPEGKLEVNHKDGDKSNNNANNLEWCTRKENVAHSVKSGLFFTMNGVHSNCKVSLETIIQVKKELANGIDRKSIAKKYNLNLDTVKHIFLGKTGKHVTI